MGPWQEFSGLNRGYVLEAYERYRQNPASVDPETRALFETWTPPADEDGAGSGAAGSVPLQKVVAAVNLAESIRRYGHLAAQLDPLGGKPPGDPSLLPATHGLTDEDLRALPAALVCGALVDPGPTAFDAIAALRRLYCGTSGYDISHVFVPAERDWLRQAAEGGRFRAPADPIHPEKLLDRLSQVEAFERFLQRTFPGKTRFSIEGLDMLVPVLDEVIGEAAESGIRNILIGMAHRGRLNVMAHVLNKPYAQILAEFKEPVSRNFREDMSWTGDVKYHAGALRAIRGGERLDVVVSMPPNPSHLEAVDPVVEGMARAAGTIADAGGPPRFDPARSVPILIHGDAAFPGQGVVAETLNLSRLPGYSTGGTIHVIANNQLGFTTVRRGFVQHVVRERAGAWLQDSDRPCQRRRPRSVRRGGAPRVRIPRAVPEGLPDRPGRLPPLRPQRRRRAGLHPAGDVPEDQRPADGPRAVGPHARRAWRDRRERHRRLGEEVHDRAADGLREAPARAGLHRADTRNAARRRGVARRHRRAARAASRAERLAQRLPARLHHPPQARTGAREEGAVPRGRRTSARSTGRVPRSWPTPRSSPTASASG